MKTISILLISISLVACTPIPPPSDEQVKTIASLCEKQGKVISIYHNSAVLQINCANK